MIRVGSGFDWELHTIKRNYTILNLKMCVFSFFLFMDRRNSISSSLKFVFSSVPNPKLMISDPDPSVN